MSMHRVKLGFRAYRIIYKSMKVFSLKVQKLNKIKQGVAWIGASWFWGWVDWRVNPGQQLVAGILLLLRGWKVAGFGAARLDILSGPLPKRIF